MFPGKFFHMVKSLRDDAKWAGTSPANMTRKVGIACVELSLTGVHHGGIFKIVIYFISMCT